jgi:hypothetical protein
MNKPEQIANATKQALRQGQEMLHHGVDTFKSAVALYESKKMAQHKVSRRAVEAAIWGMPLVSFEAMRRAFHQDAGTKYGDVCYFSKPADWKLQITTPNASSLYVFLFYNLKNGPVVIHIPAAIGSGLFGSLNDAWQVPLMDVGPEGEDKGKGAKYLLLPTGYDGHIPGGYLPIQSSTYNGYGAFRVIPASSALEDLSRALVLVKQIRVYPLAQANNPPPSRHIDIAGKTFDAIAYYDDRFYDALARMVQEEPVQPRDMVAMAQLRSIGIEKGKDFNPDQATRYVLKHAIAEAHASFILDIAHITPWQPDSHWGLSATAGPQTGFGYQLKDHLEIDERGAIFFLACAPPKKLGAASMYLAAYADAAGNTLQGDHVYHLHVPTKVPAKQFWAVTVYDLETAGFIREAPRVELNSYDQSVRKNTDGSVDVHFGPLAPPGRETNWIYTTPGKRWFAFFRFYGPEEAARNRSWKFPDIEQAK